MARVGDVLPFKKLGSLLLVSAAAGLPFVGVRLSGVSAKPILTLTVGTVFYVLTYLAIVYGLRIERQIAESEIWGAACSSTCSAKGGRF